MCQGVLAVGGDSKRYNKKKMVERTREQGWRYRKTKKREEKAETSEILDAPLTEKENNGAEAVSSRLKWRDQSRSDQRLSKKKEREKNGLQASSLHTFRHPV